MDEAEFEALKNELDRQLATAPNNVGIGFGYNLYDEFLRRKLFTPLVFAAVGFPHIKAVYPTYANRAIHQNGQIAMDGFKVGT